MIRNFKLTLSYIGTRYSGWQKQANTSNTIQGKLEQTLSSLLGTPIEVHGSGRTDAGVHAAAQVANFHADTPLSCAEICRRLRHAMPLDIGILSVEEVPQRFHARLSAHKKTYYYRIWNSDIPNVFEQKYMHTVIEPLDVGVMQEAAAYFLGTHDFRAYCSNPDFKKSAVRTVYAITVEQFSHEIRLSVTGNGFLYNMVRLIAGTLLRTGRHEIIPSDIPAILESQDRRLAGPMAPASGLCMMEVKYE